MSDNIMQQFYKELQNQGDIERELFKIKRMFDWELGKEGFVEHIQEWKDAQPLTNMTIIEKLDKLWNKADEVAGNCTSYEDEVSTAVSALEDVPYDLSHDAYGLQDDIKALMKEIKEPKEQAETDMEDSE